MTTQAQGKGKKKNKELMSVSMAEANQIDSPQGHSVTPLKGGFGGSRMSDRYGERSGGFNRDRESYGGGFNRASSGSGDKPQDRTSSYFAGAKFLSPPIPSVLPMPPKSWLKDHAG